MVPNIIAQFFADGGLLRVRGLLALGFTAIGGVYLLTQNAMPPQEFNVLWSGAVFYYFGNRGTTSGS